MRLCLVDQGACWSELAMLKADVQKERVKLMTDSTNGMKNWTFLVLLEMMSVATIVKEKQLHLSVNQTSSWFQ